MRGSLRLRFVAIHGGIAALFGILLFVVLFTGTWSAVLASMPDWWRSPRLEATGVPISIDALLPIAATQGVDLDGTRIMLPTPGDASVRFCSQQGCTLALDPVTGSRLNTASSAGILVTLHKNLYAGFPGRIFVSLFGVLLLVLLVGGIVLHGPRWKQALRLRRDRGLLVRQLDLHSLLGLWSIPWLALIGITGALSGLGALGTITLAPLAFPGQPGQVFAQLMGPPPPAASGQAWQRAPSIDEVLRDSARQYADFIPQAVTVNHWGDATATVSVAGVTRGVPSTTLFEQHLYRAEDGAMLRRTSADGRGPWVRAFIAVQPLHFAQYEWLPGAKVWYGVHVLMGIVASVLTATGLYLWVRRHRHHQPRVGSLLMAAAVGGCGGLVLSVGLLLLAGQLQIAGYWSENWSDWLFWGAWIGTIVIAFYGLHRDLVLRAIMIASGLSYLLAAVLHAVTVTVASSPNAFWLHDVLLAFLGVALIRHVWILRRESRAQHLRL